MPSAPGCALLARLKSVRRARRRVWWRKARSSQGACPFAAVFRERRGEERENAARALEAVGWFPPGGFCRAFRGGRERRLRGGPRWGGTGAFAFGRMRLRPGDARFFCGAKSRLLMAAGMAGQGKGRALFLHAAFDGSFCVGCGWLAPSGGFFLRVSRGTGGVRAEVPRGEGRARLPLGGCACARGMPVSFAARRVVRWWLRGWRAKERPRALSTRGF